MLNKINRLLYCMFHGYWIKDSIWKSRRYNYFNRKDNNDYIDLSGD